MSESIDDGGSAFPEVTTDNKNTEPGGDYRPETYSYGGMTLRDYFAARALDGLMGSHVVDEPDGCALLAEDCYKVADAMIRARAK